MIDLDEFVAPPARPGFREDVIRKGERERAAAGQRRVALLAVVSGVVVASFSTAGVFALEAGGTPRLIDRTQSHPAVVQGGVPVFHIAAHAHGVTRSQKTGGLVPLAAQLSIYVEQTATQWLYYEGVTDAKKGFQTALEPQCSKAPQVPLGPAGLPKEGVYVRNGPGLGGDFGYRCLSGNRITIRMHAVISKAGAPTAAQLIVRTGKKLRPVAFIDWTPSKVTTYLSLDCGPSQ